MSAPIELYHIVSGSEVFRQTSAANIESYESEDYIPYSIKRSQVESKNDLLRANIDVVMDLNNPAAIAYLSGPVDRVVSLTIYEVGTAPEVIWKGRLSNVKASGSKVTLTFESIFTSLRRPGLRARYQKPCRHALYGRGCRLDKDDWNIPTVVTNVVSDSILTIPDAAGYADNTFRGGMIKGPDGTYRYIVSHVGDQITLMRRYDSISQTFIDDGSVDVDLYPGCDHTPDGCAYFSNQLNYGGFRNIPKKNPFGGTSVS